MITLRHLGAFAMLALFAPVHGAQSAIEPEPSSPPATSAALAIQPESRLWVEGTSTVRDYQCEATRIEGGVELDAAEPGIAVTDLQQSVRAARLTVPVAELDCRNGTMNGHMRKALRAEDNPEITYRLTAHEIEALDNGDAVATLDGELTIAGTTQPVNLGAIVTPGPDGTLKVQGSREIIMTEFGVKPPKLMLGVLKVNPRVMVHFDVVLKQ